MATTNPETPAAEATAAAPAPASGGLSAWLPLIITVVAMPALAYVTTTFVLLPKMKSALVGAAPATPTAEESHAAPAAGGHAAPAAEPAAKGHGAAAASTELTPAMKEKGVKIAPNGKVSIPLNKILVNVAGTMGSRYLLTSVTLASSKPHFAEQVLSSEAQLLDLAAGVLSAKTIADLEKPAARTVVRTELLTVFNNVLGSGMVEDIFFTEFAIQ